MLLCPAVSLGCAPTPTHFPDILLSTLVTSLSNDVDLSLFFSERLQTDYNVKYYASILRCGNTM